MRRRAICLTAELLVQGAYIPLMLNEDKFRAWSQDQEIITALLWFCARSQIGVKRLAWHTMECAVCYTFCSCCRA